MLDALENLPLAGLAKIEIIVGDTFERIQAAVGDSSRFGARLIYVPLDGPARPGPFWCECRILLGDRRFVVYPGDGLICGGAVSWVEQFVPGDQHEHITLRHVPGAQNFGVVVKQAGISHLAEKQHDPVGDLAIVGI